MIILPQKPDSGKTDSDRLRLAVRRLAHAIGKHIGAADSIELRTLVELATLAGLAADDAVFEARHFATIGAESGKR